jgi:hypothetical protein
LFRFHVQLLCVYNVGSFMQWEYVIKKQIVHQTAFME